MTQEWFSRKLFKFSDCLIYLYVIVISNNMPVRSGKTIVMPRMKKARQFFCVDEAFVYSPLSEPDNELTLRVVEDSSDDVSPCYLCAISGWCSEPGNYDSDGVNYIPECEISGRTDGKSVYFKEI